MKRNTSDHTIKNYLDYLEDAYLFMGAKRFDFDWDLEDFNEVKDTWE